MDGSADAGCSYHGNASVSVDGEAGLKRAVGSSAMDEPEFSTSPKEDESVIFITIINSSSFHLINYQNATQTISSVKQTQEREEEEEKGCK